MTASVTLLRTARLVVVAGLTRAEREESLTWLADAVIAAPHEWPERIIADVLALYGDAGLTPEQKTTAFTKYIGERKDELSAREEPAAWAAATGEDPEIPEQNAWDALAALAGRDGGRTA
jgi:hypothetical protein